MTSTLSNVTRVYLDQNVVSHMVQTGDWRIHPIGKLLAQAEKAKVWISPTHAVETALTTNQSLRQKLAAALLDLSGGCRITFGPDLGRIIAFGAILNKVVPNSFDPTHYINPYKEQAQREWLGNLGLLAWSPNVQLGPGVEEARLTKLRSKLIQVRIAVDPDKAIEEIIECAKKFKVTPNPDPLGLDALSVSDLDREIKKLLPQIKRPTKQTLEKIKKHRAQICAVYGSVELGASIRSVFGQFPGDLIFTINVPLLVANWNAIMSQCHVKNLPLDVLSAKPKDLHTDQNLRALVFNALFAAAANVDLLILKVSYFSLLREMEIQLNTKKEPNLGASLDADHATTLPDIDVFVSQDTKLVEAAKTFLKKANRDIAVACNERQLKTALIAIARHRL